MLMPEIILILDNIRSTYNVGSIMRSAECFGVSKLLFAGYTPYPKTAFDKRLPHEVNKLDKQIQKTALGVNIPFEVFESTQEAIDYAHKNNFSVAALEQAGNSTHLPRYQCPPQLALILGNEVSGISKQTQSQTDVTIEIPILGKKESLNVAVSAAIALYSLRFFK